MLGQELVNILNAVSFIDYIVFGKWNYNKIITEFKQSKKFYNEQCALIQNFIDEHNIRLHIKEGTQTIEEI